MRRPASRLRQRNDHRGEAPGRQTVQATHIDIANGGVGSDLLRDYAEYYNRLRTHLSLNKDAPLGRPVQNHGVLCRLPHFGGLHHSFVRI